jgi:hypothetical protein
MGKNITLVGGNGDGQTCKVANQIIVALNIEAVGEALLFASKRGYVMWSPSLCSSEDLSTSGRGPEIVKPA